MDTGLALEARPPDSLPFLLLVHTHNDPRYNGIQVCLHGKGVGKYSQNGQRFAEEVILTGVLEEFGK